MDNNNSDEQTAANNIFIPLSIILVLLGLIGPGFWKIKSPDFNFQSTLMPTRSSMNLNNVNSNLIKLDQKYLNSSLSTKDIFNKEIAVAWSNEVIENATINFKVPKIFFSQLPNDLNTYQIRERKNLFISIILPLLVRGNQLVLEERDEIIKSFEIKQFSKLKVFCLKYKLDLKNCNINNDTSLKKIRLLKEKLLLRVNIFPLSMMLAQATIESGWGMSRFAKKGNALFGQWTWSINKGIKPRENQNSNFAVKSFKNLQGSVNSYILNLNTHPAYAKLRKYRNFVLINGQKFDGKNFAKYLEKYAEIGYKYVEKVIKMIKINKFDKYDKLKFEKFQS